MDVCMEQVLLGVDFPDVCGVSSCFWALCRVRAGCSATNLRSAHTTNKARRQTRCAPLGPSRCTPALSPCDNYSWPGSRPWHLVYAKCGWEDESCREAWYWDCWQTPTTSEEVHLIKPSFSAAVVFAGEKTLLLCFNRLKNVNIGPCLFKDKIHPHIISMFVHCTSCSRIWKSF